MEQAIFNYFTKLYFLQIIFFYTWNNTCYFYNFLFNIAYDGNVVMEINDANQ
jgi:hypothetical protein